MCWRLLAALLPAPDVERRAQVLQSAILDEARRQGIQVQPGGP